MPERVAVIAIEASHAGKIVPEKTDDALVTNGGCEVSLVASVCERRTLSAT
jgi:hypothetical protein